MHSPTTSVDFSSRLNLAFPPFRPNSSQCAPCVRRNSRILISLRALFLSLRSFQRSPRLFSIVCSLFLQNTRGGGAPRRRLRALCVSLPRVPRGALSFAFVFIRPLFSYCYELLFSQALCFDNHLRCPGGVRVSTCGNHAWRLRLNVLPDNSCGIKHGGECT